MKYPLLATRGVVNFPGHKTIIEVGRPESIKAISESVLNYDNKLIIVSKKNASINKVIDKEQIFQIGTLVNFQVQEDYVGGGQRIEVLGLERIKITKLIIGDFLEVEIKKFNDIVGDAIKEKALVNKISNQIDKSLGNLVNVPKNILQELAMGISAGELADIVGQYMPLKLEQKVNILSVRNINKRLELVVKILEEESQVIKIEKELDSSVRANLDKQQREYLLRERIKYIKEELGELSSKESEVDLIRKKLQDSKFPDEIKVIILEELSKYENMPQISAEANVSKTYIDWLVKLPWNTYSTDLYDLDASQKILDKYHYSLKKVKERIIEFIAVKMNTKSNTAPIICLVGPPGVGKTSLAKSIAKAINKKIVKVSLGGVRDEAEIRGHRRTYVGSMPGKIIQAINKSKISNPVILLDEIDKMASDYKGDPTSAMLEVLDIEQNEKFQDHYLEIEYDLSKVMFIATANYYENIPSPLLDRMEVIELSSYTVKEKIMIAKKHLISKVIKENGLKRSDFKINNNMVEYLINHYTLEAGVRGLKRVIDKLVRKIVVVKIKGKDIPKIINEELITKLLGKKLFSYDQKEKYNIVGQVTGLAYTQYGGATLPIEVTSFPGKGELKVTGQLKDVMNESVAISFAYVKSNAKKYKIDFDFAKNDIHVHVPEGAVPKDGPSAGVTFTTALISMLTNKGVSPDIAMTGEITLRGKVLPIGGLKEKTLAATRMGIKKVFIPEGNKKDIDELPKEVKDKLEIQAVENFEDINNILFK